MITVVQKPLFMLLSIVLLMSVTWTQARSASNEIAGPQHNSNIQPTIIISDAYARADNNYSVRVFLSLTNTSNKIDTLTGINSDIAQDVSLQVDVMEEDSVMTVMTPSVDIMPGQIIRLEPFGPHIVLKNLGNPVVPGQKFTVTLRFANSPAQDIVVSVPNMPDSTP
jgi:copper(I)-binding protein